MKHASLVLGLLAAAAQPALGQTGGNQEDYINSVCRPKLADDVDTSNAFNVPPCIAVESIEGACLPNGTSPLALEAHAQCMCRGSFFSQWSGCQQCQLFHGARSERDVAHFEAALELVSGDLCGSVKPTAAFQALFTSADYAAPIPSDGATTSSDSAPSDPAISLYFTPVQSSWGPGLITGSATGATASFAPTTAVDTASISSSSSFGSQQTTTESSTRGTQGATTATSQSTTVETTPAPGMAAPTAMAAMGGMLWAVAGGAIVAAL